MTFRKLRIGNETWEFYLGDTHAVIKDPKGHKTTVRYDVLLGRDLEEFKSAREEGWPTGSVRPRHVRTYIEQRLKEPAPIGATRAC